MFGAGPIGVTAKWTYDLDGRIASSINPRGTCTCTAADAAAADSRAAPSTAGGASGSWFAAPTTPTTPAPGSDPAVALLGKYQDIKDYIAAAPPGTFDADFLNFQGTTKNGTAGVGSWTWTRNKRYIDDALAAGKELRLVTDPDTPIYKMGNVYQRELKYLKDNGYEWIPEGDYWVVVRVRPSGGGQMSKRASGSVVKEFAGQVAQAFAGVAEEFGLAGPEKSDVVLASVSFSTGVLKYEIVHDPHSHSVETRVAFELEASRLTVGLGNLVHAAGLGPAEQVKDSAHTVSNMQRSLETQVDFVKRLHPLLLSDAAEDLIRKAGAREWRRR